MAGPGEPSGNARAPSGKRSPARTPGATAATTAVASRTAPSADRTTAGRRPRRNPPAPHAPRGGAGQRPGAAAYGRETLTGQAEEPGREEQGRRRFGVSQVAQSQGEHLLHLGRQGVPRGEGGQQFG